MVKEIEGTFEVDGASLYAKSWLPDDGTPIKAKYIHIHGFSDHINNYFGFFPYLCSRGIEVHAFDQRGWGRSVTKPAEKGLTGPTSQVVGEVAAFVRKHLDGSTVPVFVCGHSMGGGEVLTLMCDAAYDDDVLNRVRGWLLEAPFIGWPNGEQPSMIKIVLGRAVSKIFPHQHLKHVLPPENLTRDPAVVQFLKEDTLCHDTGTLEGLASLLDRTNDLSSGKAQLRPAVRSVWLGHGTADLGTGYEASREWFERQTALEDKELKTYEGWSHMLHAEPEEDRQVFYADVANWILARVGGETQQVPTVEVSAPDEPEEEAPEVSSEEPPTAGTASEGETSKL